MKNTRYFLFGLSAVCVCMIGITSLNGSLLNPLRNAVGYVLVPIQSGINAVGGSIYKEASALGSLKDAMKENEALKAQVDELTEENTRLRAEQQELERLRELYELDTQYMQYQKVEPGSLPRIRETGFLCSASTRGRTTALRRI